MTVMANTILRERVYAFPDVVNLGAIPLAVASDPRNTSALGQTLMVHSPESETFELSVTSAPSFLDVTSERGPQGDRYQLTLTLRPDGLAEGRLEGSIKLRTNDAAFPELEVPVAGEILK